MTAIVDSDGVDVKAGSIVLYPNTRGKLRWGRVLAIFMRDGEGYAAVHPHGETYTIIQKTDWLSVSTDSMVCIQWQDQDPDPDYSEVVADDTEYGR